MNGVRLMPLIMMLVLVWTMLAGMKYASAEEKPFLSGETWQGTSADNETALG